ncbi:MAG: hypothetical protein RLZZ175_2732 [Bacteroidota bacterium]
MKKINSIFVIDDDDICQYIAVSIIEHSELVKHTKVFNNGKEAIIYLENNCQILENIPEIILLDLTMPVMDGWEFIENYIKLKPRIGKKVYIYIISSSINPYDFERAKNISEVSDYIVKPLTLEGFTELVKFITK